MPPPGAVHSRRPDVTRVSSSRLTSSGFHPLRASARVARNSAMCRFFSERFSPGMSAGFFFLAVAPRVRAAPGPAPVDHVQPFVAASSASDPGASPSSPSVSESEEDDPDEDPDEDEVRGISSPSSESPSPSSSSSASAAKAPASTPRPSLGSPPSDSDDDVSDPPPRISSRR